MEKMRIGFVGVGSMGQMAHLANYVNVEGCEVAALAEVRPELGRKVAARYGIAKVYADHRAMLASEALDGVVASQPFMRHALLLPEIYPKVKHVFTEKPLALAVEAGERLVEAAADARCIHMVGYHKRSDPATAHAKQVIERWKAGGEMGRLRYVRIQMPAGDWIAGGFTGLIRTDEKAPTLESEPPPPGMDADTAEAYAAFVNYYIHQVNLMRYLLGEPYRVTYAEKSGVLMAVESESGVAGVMEMTPYRTTVAWEESALVAFEKGYVVLRLPAPLTVNRAGTVEIYRDPGDGATPERTMPTMPWVHAMRRQAENFVKVCRGEMKPPCDAAEALEDLKVARDYLLKRKALT
ncbi:MAG: Gfo/Idh/MocA family oxidoreductase [Phycisphaerae bacterium]